MVSSSPWLLGYVALVGAVIGSFGNVLILRIPEGESITGRSACPRCHRRIRWFDLIPVVSYVLLFGRCRGCKRRISAQYPLVEAATAVAFVLPRPKASIIVILLRQPSGSYIAADASGVEGGNFGKLGRPRTDYSRFETTPVKWLSREDGMFQVRMRTRAWRTGQRYTVSEDLIIKSNGTVLYR